MLLSGDRVHLAAAQSLVRIKSGDKRTYLGVVSAGPYSEPDSLNAESHILRTVAIRGGDYLPPHHGRISVSILGEELEGGSQVPARLRPLPHSPVFLLSDKEAAIVLKAEGDMRLGLAVGHEELPIRIPSDVKSVLPRHTAILGTTGGGKSTTVAGLVKQAQEAGMAVILLDVEGEYTHLHEPTDDKTMRDSFTKLHISDPPIDVEKMTLYHLVRRETTNPAHPNRREFSLQFGRLSPHTVMEMLDLNDAQTDRFLFAYEVAKRLMRELGLFPDRGATGEELGKQERMVLELDEFDRGYPRPTLSLFLDVVGHCKAAVTKSAFEPFNAALKTEEGREAFHKSVNPKDMPGIASSWGKLYSLLWRLHRLKVFDRRTKTVSPMIYRQLLQPGRLSVIDLSDTGMAEMTNIVLSDALRGIQEAQEANYREFEKARREGKPASLPRVLVVIEEAHEFLSEERIEKTHILFQQVARIAKRGRKRWLSLAFVTQLPQHLPRQLLGLVNSFILHKIGDPQVVATLRKTISNIDGGLWNRLPALAPGQAIVSFPHLTRPLLATIDPTPCKLRMADD